MHMPQFWGLVQFTEHPSGSKKVSFIKSEIDIIKNKIPEIMTSSHKNFISLKVPIKVDIGVGNSWDDAH